MNKTLSIKVNIADRFYPLKIDIDNEEKIRKAAKLINEKILQYKQRYTDKDIQDFLAMTALQFATRSVENEIISDNSEITDELKILNTNPWMWKRLFCKWT